MFGMVESLEKMIDDWKLRRNSWDEVSNLMNSRLFASLVGTFSYILSPMYYAPSTSLSNAMILELGSTAEFVARYSQLLIILLYL